MTNLHEIDGQLSDWMSEEDVDRILNGSSPKQERDFLIIADGFFSQARMTQNSQLFGRNLEYDDFVHGLARLLKRLHEHEDGKIYPPRL